MLIIFLYPLEGPIYEKLSGVLLLYSFCLRDSTINKDSTKLERKK